MTDNQLKYARRNEIWDALVDATEKDVELRMALEKINPFVFLRLVDALAERIS